MPSEIRFLVGELEWVEVGSVGSGVWRIVPAKGSRVGLYREEPADALKKLARGHIILHYKSTPFRLPYEYDGGSGLVILEAANPAGTTITAETPRDITRAKLRHPYRSDEVFRNNVYHALETSVSLRLQDHRGIRMVEDDRPTPSYPLLMEIVTGCVAHPVKHMIEPEYGDIARLPTNYIYRRHLKEDPTLEKKFQALEEIAIALLGFERLGVNELDKISKETLYLLRQ